MVEQIPSGEPRPQRRRSARVVQTVPITITGVDALGQPFKERTSTVTINCHGCKYLSQHYVLKNAWVTIEIPHPQAGQPPRSVRARACWVLRPRTVQELFQVGAELEIPGNVWGIAFPPEDWFPFPEAPAPEIPAPPAKTLPPPPAVAPPPAAALPPVVVPPPPAALPPPPRPVPEDKVRTMPSPAEREATDALARQMSRLLANAQQQIQIAVKETAAAAVAAETGQLLRELNVRLQSTAEEAVKSAAAASLEGVMQRAEEKLEEMRRAAAGALEQQWKAQLERSLSDLGPQLAARFEQSQDSLRQAFNARMDTDLGQASGRAEALRQALAQQVEAELAQTSARLESLHQAFHQQIEQTLGQAAGRREEVEQRIRNLQGEIGGSIDNAQARIEQLWSDADVTAAEARARLRKQLQGQSEEALARLAELEQAAQKLREAAVAAADQAHAAWRERLETDMALAGTAWNSMLEAAISGAGERLTGQLGPVLQGVTGQAEQDLRARVAAAREAFEKTVAGAQDAFGSIRRDLHQDLEHARASLGEIERSRREVGEYETRLEAIRHTIAEALQQRADQILTARIADLEQHGEHALASLPDRLKLLIEAVQRESLERFRSDAEQQLVPHFERAREAIEKLAAGQQAAKETTRAQLDRLREASEAHLRDSLARAQEIFRGLQKDFEESTRGALAKCLAELDEKSTEATHTTFEALYKAAEWYQKKAQTSMQTTLEKIVEQAAGSLREQAAETSRLFSDEIAHRSRSFAEQTEAQLDENARDLAERTNAQLDLDSAAALARFGDEVHRAADQKFQGLAETVQKTVEQATARMETRAGEVRAEVEAHAEHVRSRADDYAEQTQARAEAQAEEAYGALDRRIGERLEQGVAQASEQFQASLVPILDSLREQREAQQREWMERLARQTGESVEQYKQRLENVSNSWMVASVTTLNSHSQAVMEALARAAEQRLRETFSETFAALAERLRQQILNISSQFQPEPPPPEKK